MLQSLLISSNDRYRSSAETEIWSDSGSSSPVWIASCRPHLRSIHCFHSPIAPSRVLYRFTAARRKIFVLTAPVRLWMHGHCLKTRRVHSLVCFGALQSHTSSVARFSSTNYLFNRTFNVSVGRVIFSRPAHSLLDHSVAYRLLKATHYPRLVCSRRPEEAK